MPKRRVTAKRKAQLARWQAAGVAARRRSAWPDPHGEWGVVRRHKLRAKASQNYSGGTVTVAPAAAQLLAGKPVTHGSKEFHPNTIRGDIVQTQGTPYRKKRKAK